MDALTKVVDYGCRTFALADKGLQAVGDFAINASESIGEAAFVMIDIPKGINPKTLKVTVGATVILSSLSSCIIDANSQEFLNSIEVSANENKFENDPTLFTPSDSLPAGTGTSFQDSPIITNNSVLNIPSTFGSPSSFLINSLLNESVPTPGLGEEEFSQLSKIVNYEGSTPFREAIQNINSSSQWKFYKLFVEYNKVTGEKINLKSAWRSPTKQRELLRLYGNVKAAGVCGSPHAVAAIDVDRSGDISVQVDKMKKLGLLNKYGLWVPPEVGEAWHIEDPDAVWFRYLKRKDPERKSYGEYVCSGLNGTQHTQARIADNLFSIKNSFVRISKTADKVLADKEISGINAVLLKQYLLFSVRSESFYGKTMISKTGAKGWWQFTGPVAKQYNLKYVMQLEESARATVELALDNAKSLNEYGIDPTVENIYFSHVIGARGLSLVKKTMKGNVLSEKDSETVLKIVAAQLPKEKYDTFFTGKLSEAKLKEGFSIKDVVVSFDDFFNKRFTEYHADNSYLAETVGVV